MQEEEERQDEDEEVCGRHLAKCILCQFLSRFLYGLFYQCTALGHLRTNLLYLQYVYLIVTHLLSKLGSV